MWHSSCQRFRGPIVPCSVRYTDVEGEKPPTEGSHCVRSASNLTVAESARSAKSNRWGPIIKASDEPVLRRKVELWLCTLFYKRTLSSLLILLNYIDDDDWRNSMNAAVQARMPSALRNLGPLCRSYLPLIIYSKDVFNLTLQPRLTEVWMSGRQGTWAGDGNWEEHPHLGTLVVIRASVVITWPLQCIS